MCQITGQQITVKHIYIVYIYICLVKYNYNNTEYEWMLHVGKFSLYERASSGVWQNLIDSAVELNIFLLVPAVYNGSKMSIYSQVGLLSLMLHIIKTMDGKPVFTINHKSYGPGQFALDLWKIGKFWLAYA